MKLNRRELAAAIMGSTAAVSAAKPAQDSAVKSEPAADCVRATLTETLEGQFEDFLKGASIGDLYLMHEVLLMHNGESLGIHARKPELVLPAAFEEQTGRGVPCFVAVPEELQADVERYVDMLVRASRGGRQ